RYTKKTIHLYLFYISRRHNASNQMNQISIQNRVQHLRCSTTKTRDIITTNNHRYVSRTFIKSTCAKSSVNLRLSRTVIQATSSRTRYSEVTDVCTNRFTHELRNMTLLWHSRVGITKRYKIICRCSSSDSRASGNTPNQSHSGHRCGCKSLLESSSGHEISSFLENM